MKLSPSLLIKASISLILIANAFILIDSFEEVKAFNRNHFGFYWSKMIYKNISAIISILLGLGYGSFLLMIYTKFRENNKSVVLLGMAPVVMLFSVNAYFTPSEPKLRDYIPKYIKNYIKEGFDLQQSDGGFRTKQDLPASATQVWSTAQYIKAILSSGETLNNTQIAKVRAAFQFIENMRVSDEGWGYTNESTWGVTEIAAWTVLAYISSIDPHLRIWSPKEQAIVLDRIKRDLELISSRQHSDGGWSPVSEVDQNFCRTYSTSMALWAMVESIINPEMNALSGSFFRNKYNNSIHNGSTWLLNTYRPPKGWSPSPYITLTKDVKYKGLNAQVLFILGRVSDYYSFTSRQADIYREALSEFLNQNLSMQDPAVNERCHDSFRFLPKTLKAKTHENSTFLWYPWSLALARQTAVHPDLPPDFKSRAVNLEQNLVENINEMVNFSNQDFSYVSAETLLCLSYKCCY